MGDARLAQPLLTYIDSREKLGSRSATNTGAVAFGFMAAAYAVLATRASSHGRLSETLFYALLAALMTFAAGIWPAVGRASRRNLEAARQAACATLQPRPEAEPATV